jgi:hypothetical protein
MLWYPVIRGAWSFPNRSEAVEMRPSKVQGESFDEEVAKDYLGCHGRDHGSSRIGPAERDANQGAISADGSADSRTSGTCYDSPA